MVIRNLHLTDFLKLGRLHEANVGLDVPGSLVLPHSLRGVVLSQHLPASVQSYNSNIYIYEEPEGNPCAFVQARTRQRRDEWDILALGTIGKNFQSPPESTDNSAQAEPVNEALAESFASDQETAQVVSSTDIVTETDNIGLEIVEADSESEAVTPEDTIESEEEDTAWPSISEAEVAWSKLLEHLVTDAGERGVMRIYAKLSEDSSEMDLFNQTGFHTFTHELLFRLNYRTGLEKPANVRMRPQRSRDLFPIDQLYRAVTPGLVQHAENSSSRTWSISRNYFPRPLKEQGFVLEENDKIVAYLRLLSHRNHHLLTVMCLDSQRETLVEIIRYGLSSIKAGEDVQVYCTVREYQSEQATTLEDLGFEYFGKQAAMVKHIVQYIKNVERALAHARDHKLELAHSVIKRRLRPAVKAGQPAFLKHKSGWGNT